MWSLRLLKLAQFEFCYGKSPQASALKRSRCHSAFSVQKRKLLFHATVDGCWYLNIVRNSHHHVSSNYHSYE